METVIIIIHLMVVVALVAVVLVQRSEGGALGIGGGGGFLTTRGTANVLTRSTAVLATVFFLTSIGLTMLARYGTAPSSILETGPSAGNSGFTGNNPSVNDLINQFQPPGAGGGAGAGGAAGTPPAGGGATGAPPATGNAPPPVPSTQ